MSERTPPLSSANLSMIAMIVSHAARVLGSPERAAEWLRTPDAGLGDRTPLACMDDDEGIDLVRAALITIERGGG